MTDLKHELYLDMRRFVERGGYEAMAFSLATSPKYDELTGAEIQRAMDKVVADIKADEGATVKRRIDADKKRQRAIEVGEVYRVVYAKGYDKLDGRTYVNPTLNVGGRGVFIDADNHEYTVFTAHIRKKSEYDSGVVEIETKDDGIITLKRIKGDG